MNDDEDYLEHVARAAREAGGAPLAPGGDGDSTVRTLRLIFIGVVLGGIGAVAWLLLRTFA